MENTPHAPTKWRMHPVSYLVGPSFGVLLLLVESLLITPASKMMLNWLDYPDFGMPLMVLQAVAGIVTWLIAWSCFSGLMSGLRTTWWLDADKVNEHYKGVSQDRSELHYWRIDEVRLSQSLLGRMFGYGTLRLTPRGKDNAWVIPGAPRPHELREYFSHIATENKQEVTNPPE